MHIFGTRVRHTSIVATDFLRQNEKMASLLPTAMRMGNLQRDIAVALPAMFAACDVLSFHAGALVLAVPSSAVAARLKQQLPKLQSALQGRGWQVEAVRLKVQVTRDTPPEQLVRNLELPPAAVTAFEELGDALPDTPQNAGLIAALRSMAARRKG